MASMEDLIATMSGGLHAGQQGNDLRDLHAKLAQTIQHNPHYRPIPPASGFPGSSSSSFSGGAIPGTHSSTGPLPPPAPASSWNSPPPHSGFMGHSPSFGQQVGSAGMPGAGAGAQRQGGWVANSRETGFNLPHQSQTGGQAASAAHTQSHAQASGSGPGGIPAPKSGSGLYVPNGNAQYAGMSGNGNAWSGSSATLSGRAEEEASRPYHASVLPMRASPKDTGGFADDAFKPLWAGRNS